MTSMELFDLLGNTRDSYVREVQQIRSGECPAKPKRMPKKRMLLIAAVVALTLLLLGCAVVYVLRMQNLTVGEYDPYIPVAYDENGEIIPVEPQRNPMYLSIQGVHMDALAEWLEFTEHYDRDGTIMLEADRSRSSWDLPDSYHLTYGCYSQEMIDKLDEISAKYDLKLLSAYITCQRYEMDVMFQALGFDGVMLDSPKIEVEYADGDFYLQGSFWLELFLSMDGEHWKCDEEIVSVRYSNKNYFDPNTSLGWDIDNYTQWDYTRTDGKQVLLALSKGSARIYADLGDAMMTVSLDGHTWVDGQEITMTAEALEEIAELVDLSIRPHAADPEEVDRLKAEAMAAYEVEQAAKQKKREEQYNAGYKEYADYYMSFTRNHGGASYILWDVNGDGVEEIVVNGDAILSVRDGESYMYFDLFGTGIIPAGFRPCEGNVFEVWSDMFTDDKYYFYQAGPEGVTFLTGVRHLDVTGQWYQVEASGNQTEISEAEAQAIRAGYPHVDFDWIPLKYFGTDYTPPNYSDPYANHIANYLARFEKAQDYEYALLDIDGNGVQELIAKDSQQERDHQIYYNLTVYTIRDGKVKKVAYGISHVLEGGILETSEEHVPNNDGREFYEFSRYREDTVEMIEKVVRDSATSYWGRVEAGKEGRTVREEEALSVIESYKSKRIKLDMKPCSDYPFR